MSKPVMTDRQFRTVAITGEQEERRPRIIRPPALPVGDRRFTNQPGSKILTKFDTPAAGGVHVNLTNRRTNSSA